MFKFTHTSAPPAKLQTNIQFEWEKCIYVFEMGIIFRTVKLYPLDVT